MPTLRTHLPLLLLLACGPAPKGPAPAAPAAPGPSAPQGPSTSTPGTGAPLPDGEVGGDGPVVVEAIAADGSWVLMCQARVDTDGDGALGVNVGYHGDVYGDTMDSYLILGSGPGEQVDDLIATDPAGGHLVVQRDGVLLLEHPRTGTRLDLTALGADATDDGSPFHGHRAASFDDDGNQLVYLREVDGRTQAVVRDLGAGGETVVDPGPGELWRAHLSPTGAWLSLWVIATDTDGDGALTWPRVRTSLSGRRCRGPISSYSTGGASGDRPITRLARVGQTAREIPGAIAFFGDQLLVRAASGAIVLDDGAGSSTEIIPAACGARLTHGDPDRQRVVAVCAAASAPELRLYTPAAAPRSLGAPDQVPQGDELAPFGRHIFQSGADLNTIVIDVETGARRTVDTWQRVLATSGDRTLVNRGGSLVLLDGAGERVLADLDDDYPDVHISDRYVVANRYVVDLEAGALAGQVDGQPLGITEAGVVLVAPTPERPVIGGALPHGPLRWVRPTAR